MVDINKIKENIDSLSKEIGNLNIDSIFIEQDGKLDKIFYKDEQLHELRSCSKVLVAMAIGIAIEDKMLVNGIPLSLDTKIFPSIKNLVKIKNKNNLLKIQTWTIKNLLTHTTGYESQMMSERYIEDIDKNAVSVNEFLQFSDKQNEKFSVFYYKTTSKLNEYTKQINKKEQEAKMVKRSKIAVKEQQKKLKKLDKELEALYRERDSYYNKQLEKFDSMLNKKQSIKWEILQEMGYRFFPEFD